MDEQYVLHASGNEKYAVGCKCKICGKGVYAKCAVKVYMQKLWLM